MSSRRNSHGAGDRCRRAGRRLADGREECAATWTGVRRYLTAQISAVTTRLDNDAGARLLGLAPVHAPVRCGMVVTASWR